jgi:hypothetical protein
MRKRNQTGLLESYHLKEREGDRRISLRWILRKWVRGCRMNVTISRSFLMADLDVGIDEPSGPV